MGEAYTLTWLLDICLILSDRAGPVSGVEKLTDNMFPITSVAPWILDSAELIDGLRVLKRRSTARAVISPKNILCREEGCEEISATTGARGESRAKIQSKIMGNQALKSGEETRPNLWYYSSVSIVGGCTVNANGCEVEAGKRKMMVFSMPVACGTR